MKTLFDINESLKLCPPKYQPGVKFVKRIILNRSSVTYHIDKNPRVLNVVAERIPDLRDSFLTNGFIHTEPPPTIKVDPSNKDRFIGLSGYHRNAAAEQANWKTMMYDVLEFDSPKDERTHRLTSNHVFTPCIPNTVEDLVKQLREAVANKEIPNIESEIKDYIKIIAADKPESVKDKIFKNFKKTQSVSDTLLCYHSGSGENSTTTYAKKHGLPFSGRGNWKTTGRLGYITKESTPRITLHDAKHHSKNHADQIIEIYAYIQSPIDGKALNRQRKEYKESFDRFIENDCLMLQHQLRIFGFDVPLSDIKKKHPVRLVGFLPQDITPDPFNNGKPKENGIVDVNGRSIDWQKFKTKIYENTVFDLLGNNDVMSQKMLDTLNT